MTLRRARLARFSLPLVRPLATAHERIDQRRGFLVEIEDEAGTRGYGEATPLPEFGTETREACERALEGALESAPAFFTSGSATAEGPGRAGLSPEFEALAQTPCARSALATAALDLAARRAGHSLAFELARHAAASFSEAEPRDSEPGRERAAGASETPAGVATPGSRVCVQALVGGTTPDEVAAAARAALHQGHRAFKLKLAVTSHARGFAADCDRIDALRSVVGPSACLRLDANEAWDEEEARAALEAFAPFSVDFVEQPLPRGDRAGLRRLSESGAVTVAADEALLGTGVESCLAEEVARVFVLKPAALGGPFVALDVARRALRLGIRVVWSTLIDGAVGRAVPLALAAVTGAESEVHGLGTAGLLAEDLVSPDVQRDVLCEGFLEVPTGAGLGFDPRPPSSQDRSADEVWSW